MYLFGFKELIEGTAPYAGLLLAPTEGFGLQPRHILPYEKKKPFYVDLGIL